MTTKNATNRVNILGSGMKLAEKQESIQKLIGGVFEIFSKFAFNHSHTHIELNPNNAEEKPEEQVISFQDNIENKDNDTLRKTPEINFHMKSRPKYAGFVSSSSHSGRQKNNRKYSSNLEKINLNDFKTSGVETENLSNTNDYQTLNQNMYRINQSEEKNLI